MNALGKNNLRIRVEADWPLLLDLWQSAWGATYGEIDFAARRDWLVRHVTELEKNGALTLCLRDSISHFLAGFVVINPATGWLDQLCVHPREFGSGKGGELLEAARSISPDYIKLDVNIDNIRAIRFYERNGFRRIGTGANTMSGRSTVIMEWKS